jgi:type I restriction enzyme M protein
MLIEVVQHVKDTGGNPRLLWGKLHGQEKSLGTSAIARMNLLLHGVEDFHIVKDDTLRRPAFFTGDTLARFECVIANPPFSLQAWGADVWAADPWGRNAVGGTPRDGNADWAWVQHMVASMKPVTGRTAVVLPQGALFRGGAEGRIRTAFLKADVIEAVIGLAPNLFYGTGLAACVLVLRAKKDESRKGKVLFIDAQTLFRKGRNQNTLEPEHADRIRSLYSGFADEAGFAKVVDAATIEGNGYNLNLPLYVEPPDDTDQLTLKEVLNRLEQAHAAVLKSRATLEKHLDEWGLA